METVVIVAGVEGNVVKSNADYIGVDRGCLFCVENGITPILGVGDFDSVDKNLFDFPLLVYPKEKDETDLELAIAYAVKRYKKIIVSNAIGKRSDHFLYNLKLLKKYDNLVLMNDLEKIYILKQGVHEIFNTHQYFSFFALQKTKLSLIDFKYPVENEIFTELDFKTVSNELLKDTATIKIDYGMLLCIQTSERR